MVAKLIIWEALKPEYMKLFYSCQIHAERLPYIDKIVDKLNAGKPRYEAVAKQIGCPWWFVGMLHSMECSFDFTKHLHNGDRLTDRTHRVPAGRPAAGKPPFTFEESALDALRLKGIHKITDWSIARALYLFEGYNGFGYRQYHPEVLSPYLWSFSNHYKIGKYVADGHFDAKTVSGQAGVAVVLARAVQRGIIKLEDQHA